MSHKCEHPLMRTPRMGDQPRPLPKCGRPATHETEDVTAGHLWLCQQHAAGWVRSCELVFGELVEEPTRIK